MSARGLIIGAPRSGSGKTSVTHRPAARLRPARHRGARREIRARTTSIPASTPPRPAGPASTSTAGRCTRRCSPALPREAAGGADLVIVESAMGLFDGIPASAGRSGAAADLARLYRLPVLLVLDVSGQSQTAAAVAKGFADLRSRRCAIAGVVLNRRRQRAAPAAGRATRSRRSACRSSARSCATRRCRCPSAISAWCRRASMPPRSASSSGWRTSWRARSTSTRSWRWPRRSTRAGGDFSHALPPPGQRIALAEDAAFTFLYPHVAAEWRAAGRGDWCRSRRSPTSRRRTIATSAGCPAAIRNCTPARSRRPAHFRAGMQRFAATRPVHGECGGFMVLGEDTGRCRWQDSRNARPARPCDQLRQAPMNLGYRQARLHGRLPARRGRRDDPRPRIPLRADDRCRRRRAAGRDSPTARASRSARSAAGAATSPAPSSTPSPRAEQMARAADARSNRRRHRRLPRLLHAAAGRPASASARPNFADALWAAPRGRRRRRRSSAASPSRVAALARPAAGAGGRSGAGRRDARHRLPARGRRSPTSPTASAAATRASASSRSCATAATARSASSRW